MIFPPSSKCFIWFCSRSCRKISAIVLDRGEPMATANFGLFDWFQFCLLYTSLWFLNYISFWSIHKEKQQNCMLWQSVCMRARIWYWRDCHDTWYWEVSLKSVEPLWLKSDNNKWCFTSRSTCISMHILA